MSDGGEALRSRFAPALVAVHDAALLLDAEGVVLEANVRARTEWGVQVGDAWDWIREGSWTERGLQDAGCGDCEKTRNVQPASAPATRNAEPRAKTVAQTNAITGGHIHGGV